MPERSPSGRVTAELEAELARLDRDQLLRLCAHLIRTYVIEPGRPGSRNSAPTEQRAAARSATTPPPVATAPMPAETPTPPTKQGRRTQTEPQPPAREADGRFNKLEMD